MMLLRRRAGESVGAGRRTVSERGVPPLNALPPPIPQHYTLGTTGPIGTVCMCAWGGGGVLGRDVVERGEASAFSSPGR